MPHASSEDHFARASQRHYEDAVYLNDDGRLPNADYHYGFAVECALKSILLRYYGATSHVAPGNPPAPPKIAGVDGKKKSLGHLPALWSDVAALLNGRSGGMLASILAESAPFTAWSVDHRYSDGTAITEDDVRNHRAAAERILGLHQQAIIAGDLP